MTFLIYSLSSTDALALAPYIYGQDDWCLVLDVNFLPWLCDTDKPHRTSEKKRCLSAPEPVALIRGTHAWVSFMVS